ncbi:putative Histidine kinase [Desulfamplus magnetovallimortis]|uniref:histidine kinase n=1 Tax=Desulfamplus magnetovallimortis TaxID=1246637 RepID=A0A1W1H6P5_9BACT|nr:MASE3 domain-containing protein [Desulfamplus magnetovallimortis]SLM28055.1 putative Histidine kinase [Desulfamplus magnetovallimortis]
MDIIPQNTNREYLSELYTNLITLAAILFALYMVSRFNFLLFHGIAEIFSITVAWGVFLLVWNARKFAMDNSFTFLGVAYLFVGFIDLLHTLSYKGMGVFALESSANIATQLWISARYMEAISLLIFPMLIKKKVTSINFILFIYSAVTSIVIISIFMLPLFPVCYIEGTGLTFFKKGSEYSICVILAFAALLMFFKRNLMEARVYKLIIISIGITICAELCFTFYVSVYGLSNLMGHFFKIISFYIIFIAIIKSGFKEPYSLIFHGLLEEKKSLEQNIIVPQKRSLLIMESRLRINQFSFNCTVEELLQKVLDEVEMLTESRIGFIHFVDWDKNSISLQMWSSATLSNACNIPDSLSHYPIDRAGIWADSLRTGKPVIHNDYEKAEGKKGLPPGHISILRELTVPVFRGDCIVAILGVGNKPSPYTQEDIETVTSIASMGWDIIERKKAEDALEKSQKMLESIIENSPALISIYDNNGRYQLANQSLADVIGIPPEKIIDHSFNDLLPQEISEQFMLRINEIFKTGKSSQFKDNIFLNANSKDYITTLFPVQEENGNIKSAGAISIDVTENILIQEEILRLKSAIDQVQEGIIITDSNGIITFVNPGFEKITGYSQKESMGKNPRFLKSGKQDSGFYRKMWETLKAGRTWSGRIVNRHKNGALFTEDTTISPVLDENGKILNFIAIKKDITEELDVQRRLEQAQKMEAIGTLAGGIAHDFNNMLFPIMGHTEMLKDDLPKNSPLHHYVDSIMEAAGRSSELVKQILAFSRQSDGEAEPTMLQPVIKEVLKLLRSTFPSTIRINHNINANCSMCLINPVKFHQVLMNIATNSLHAMESKGKGELFVSLNEDYIDRIQSQKMDMPEGTYACLEITDTGCGIDSSIASKIFDPYFTTKAEGKGTGMGLAVIHGIVNNAGGHVCFQSNPETGTTFKVYLPCITEEKKPMTETGNKYNESIKGGDEHLLLVDDEAPVIEMIKLLLMRLGYSISSYSSSIAALEAFRQSPEKFDLLITDLIMPDMTGDRLTSAIKKIRADIPVILCTGFSDELNMNELKSTGVDEIILKPVLNRDIAAAIRKLLDTSPTTKEI